MDRQERKGKTVFGKMERVHSRRKYVRKIREFKECKRENRRI